SSSNPGVTKLLKQRASLLPIRGARLWSVGEKNALALMGVNKTIGLVVSEKEKKYIIGISGRNSAPSLVSVGGICPIIGVSGRNSAPSLVSVGGIVPHHWYQWEE
ncbi:unnamed protein product, partial [Staurois parvus]